MDDLTLPLPGLSQVLGKPIVARFDGGPLSSDSGVLILREDEQRLGVAERLAGCIADPRAQDQVVHGLGDMIRFRMLMIAAGYEDGNDASAGRACMRVEFVDEMHLNVGWNIRVHRQGNARQVLRRPAST